MTEHAVKEELKYTYQDYCLFPEDKRYEIINGDAYMVPAPLTRHQKIIGKLYVLMVDYLKKSPIGEAWIAPVDVVLSEHDIVQPDLLFITNERKSIVTEANVQGAPDWVCEILSPSSIERDRDLKLKLYSRHGVKEYWIIDPEARSIEVYCFEDNVLTLKQTSLSGSAVSYLLPLFEARVDEVFAKIASS
ncbi:MAG: Uma2 family endonuclease [Candidatus Hinthialibacter antarcticus]|nr:Uma2 family endonuclease [Candidatus Hinthialibacter antarcticus]